MFRFQFVTDLLNLGIGTLVYPVYALNFRVPGLFKGSGFCRTKLLVYVSVCD